MDCKLLLVRIFVTDWPRAVRFYSETLGLPLAFADVYRAYDELVAKGVEFLEPPELMPWGGVLANFRDPDGNVLTLVGPPRERAS